MPDLIEVFGKRWKFIVGFTLLVTVVAFIAALLSPRQYLSTATALPANSMTGDKARVYNQNIELLYSEFGTADELDRFEGSGALDTLFIATASDLNLSAHYGIEASDESLYKAALKLKKNSKIQRSAYGELLVKVWDEERNMSATLANSLMRKMRELHQHLQNETNINTLEKLKKDLLQKQKDYRALSDSMPNAAAADEDIFALRKTSLLGQMQEEQKLIGQYQLAVEANPQVLLTVENARTPLWPDKPKIPETVLISFFAALIFSFLLVLLLDRRKQSL
jgi:capsular polysaccharide biosynthesis protein